MNNIKLNDDGSMAGRTFSGDKYTGEFPRAKRGIETYSQYNERVKKAKEQGFNLGDLGWDDWDAYCKGSGTFEGVNSDDIIR